LSRITETIDLSRWLEMSVSVAKDRFKRDPGGMIRKGILPLAATLYHADT
jgi:hypothetical protein